MILFLPDSSKDEPALFKYIRFVVCKSTTKILSHLVSMMQENKDQSGPLVRQHLPENVLSKIPKEWNYIPQDPKLNETNKSM